MSFQIGHLYNFPTANNDATIFDWFSRSRRVVETLKGSFLKVAYVLPLDKAPASAPALSSELLYEPVYMDIRGQEDSLCPQFSIPNGWKQIWVYMDDDLVTWPVIQKVVESEHKFFQPEYIPPLNNIQSNNAVDDDYYSVMSSFNGDWTGTELSGFGTIPSGSATNPPAHAAVNMELLPLAPPAVDIEPANRPASSGFWHTFLLRPRENITLGNQTLLTFVFCNPDVFMMGIVFKGVFMKATFPAASVCIQDARILARQYLNLNGLASDLESFQGSCKAYLVEMTTVARHVGQPPEQDQMIYKEQLQLIKSLKDVGFPLVDDLQRAHMGGFCMGLMLWDGEVTSVKFTRCSEGKLYCCMPILILLSLRILQPIRGFYRSPLDLFLGQYDKIPDPLLAAICGIFVIYFRRGLPGHPLGRIEYEEVEIESESQLRLLTIIRRNGSSEAHELNAWMNTRDGPRGWHQDLLMCAQPECTGHCKRTTRSTNYLKAARLLPNELVKFAKFAISFYHT
ncbi:hypothetical protein BDR06DRAFT_974959 [Suillus hirtellus]|nr:hypothetical protein BDR06DRAFT_974959 [Suillus hirtellus]